MTFFCYTGAVIFAALTLATVRRSRGFKLYPLRKSQWHVFESLLWHIGLTGLFIMLLTGLLRGDQ